MKILVAWTHPLAGLCAYLIIYFPHQNLKFGMGEFLFVYEYDLKISYSSINKKAPEAPKNRISQKGIRFIISEK